MHSTTRAVTRLESSPPDRRQPIRLSAISLFLTASLSSILTLVSLQEDSVTAVDGSEPPMGRKRLELTNEAAPRESMS